MADEILSFVQKELELNKQLYEVQNNIKNGVYTIDDLGSILPAAIIMHDLNNRQPVE